MKQTTPKLKLTFFSLFKWKPPRAFNKVVPKYSFFFIVFALQIKFAFLPPLIPCGYQTSQCLSMRTYEFISGSIPSPEPRFRRLKSVHTAAATRPRVSEEIATDDGLVGRRLRMGSTSPSHSLNREGKE